jgi:hypothetical protein
MFQLFGYENKRIISLKRFWILVILSFIGALGWIIYTKVTFFNDFMFTIRAQKYALFVFNLLVGVIIIISQYRRKYTKTGIELTETYNTARRNLVTARWLSGLCVIFCLYIAMLLWMLLLGIIFGAHNTAFQIKVMIISYLMDMIAVMGNYSIALFLLFLTAFPIFPILVYTVLMWLYPVYIDRVNFRGFTVFIYTATKDSYSAFLLGSVNLIFVWLFIAYAVLSLLLSMLVFKFKKKERKKKKKKKKVSDAPIPETADTDNINIINDNL